MGGHINSKEFEEIAEIYDQIRQWNSSNQPPVVEDAKLAELFDGELKEVMKSISETCQ